MKKLPCLFLIATLSLGCVVTELEENVDRTPWSPTLTIMINDLSKSTTHIDFSLAEWHRAWRYDALHGGCLLAALRITSSSYPQKPFITNLVQIDTLEPTGSIYRKNRIRQENENKLAVASTAFDRWKNTLRDTIFLPKDEPYSDVNGALEGARQLATAFRAKGYHIRLLILSDLHHDLPDRSSLKTVQLPQGTQVLVVGGGYNIPYRQIFPGVDFLLSPVFKVDLLLNVNA